MLQSVAAANDPCDKVRAIGTGLSTAKININYTCIGELSKVNAQVSLVLESEPISLLSERTNTKQDCCVVSYRRLTLMNFTRKESVYSSLVMILHKVDI